MPAGYQDPPTAETRPRNETGLPGEPGSPADTRRAEQRGSLRRASLHAVVECTAAGGNRLRATTQLPQVPAVVAAGEAELLVRIEALDVVGIEPARILRRAATDLRLAGGPPLVDDPRPGVRRQAGIERRGRGRGAGFPRVDAGAKASGIDASAAGPGILVVALAARLARLERRPRVVQTRRGVGAGGRPAREKEGSSHQQRGD